MRDELNRLVRTIFSRPVGAVTPRWLGSASAFAVEPLPQKTCGLLCIIALRRRLFEHRLHARAQRVNVVLIFEQYTERVVDVFFRKFDHIERG